MRQFRKINKLYIFYYHMDDAKNQYKPKFKSEFSMGELDFKEFAMWQSRANLSSAVIQSCEVPELEVVQRYFSELNVLYKLWKPLMSSPNLKSEFETIKLNCRTKKRIWEQGINSGISMNKAVIFTMIDELDNFHEKLFDIKQIIGLGIVVKKTMTTHEKIANGIRRKSDFSDLPEA